MAKVGISISLNLSKINKERLYRGQKGVYLDATVFVDLDELDQYGQSGMITQSWKDQQKGEGAILGNAKVFWKDQGQAPQQQQQPQQGFAQPQQPAQGFQGGFGSHAPQQQPQGQPVQQGAPDDFDIPFWPSAKRNNPRWLLRFIHCTYSA